MKNTRIPWAHHTVNFWQGCTVVSEACVHCYARTIAKLFSRGRATWGPAGLRWLRHQAAVIELGKLEEDARRRGVVERVFINSMSDTFEDRRDLDEAREFLFALGGVFRHLQLLLLTKRPENINHMVPPSWLLPGEWPEEFWIGTTVEHQAAANQRIPELLQVPAYVRFLSMEPLLEYVDLRRVRLPDYQESLATYDVPNGTAICDGMNEPAASACDRISWAIVGGESGAGHRQMDLAACERLVADFVVCGLPVFVKQDSGPRPDKQGRIPDVVWAHKEVPA